MMKKMETSDRLRGIKRHGAVQRSLTKTGKSKVASLDDTINSLLSGKEGGEKKNRLVFSEVPFNGSRVDIVVLVPGKTIIFVEFKTTKLDKPPKAAYDRQITKSFRDFMKYVSSPARVNKYRSSRTEGIKFYYLLTVEKCGGKDETTIARDGLVIPDMKYGHMFADSSDRHKAWIRKKLSFKTKKKKA